MRLTEPSKQRNLNIFGGYQVEFSDVEVLL
jgi:hypothetical protein